MTRPDRPRVFLADDHELLLEAFRKLLEPKCEIVGTARNGRELLEAAPKLAPDVVVLDVSMPELGGLEAGAQLRAALPGVKLIYLTVNEDPDIAAEALRQGASGYVVKSAAASELFRALEEARAGRTFVSPRVTGSEEPGAVEALRRRKPAARLTPRQVEVLALLAKGRSMKQVAHALGLTPRTVAFHKYRMMQTLGIESTAELVQYAVRHDLTG
jgi:DNA-binding NarL/FixJ family response regulator